jgi:hypothetical protein
MIVTPHFICIHLQKTGGSFIREYLTNNIPNAKYNGIVHDKACDIPKRYRQKPILGTIRNPWDWYVSWYASTQRTEALKGPFKVLHPNGKQTNFVEFMSKIANLNTKVHNIDFGLINRLGIGIYTYYYIQSYCRNQAVVFKALKTKSITDDMVFNIHLCRTENLREDLTNFLADTTVGITEQQKNTLATMAKVNTSKHGRYQEYYDAKLRQSVEKMDKYIVNRFGYTFE